MRTSLRRALCLALLTYAPLVAAQTHFSDCLAPTGTNASIIIPGSATVTSSPTSGTPVPITSGDELAVFTPDGDCAGTVTWTTDGVALAAWGVDPQSKESEGFSPGDTLVYRLWDASETQELAATEVTYDEIFDASGLFAPDAVAFIVTMVFGEGVPVDDEDDAPTFAFALEPNYPNPFATSTTLGFSIPEAARVRLEVYDLLGRRVATLVDEDRAPGQYAAVLRADGLANGTYVARLVAGLQSTTQRLLLMR